jgi:hypothetical protein
MSRLDRIETTILDVPRQKGAIQIPPDARSVRKLVIPLLQRLFLVRPINVAELGQARVARCERDQLAASRGLSLKHPHEHAEGANLEALFAMLRAASSMIAHALSSAGEVRNGSSRMKEGVRLRGIGQEILVASTGFSPQCEKGLRRLRSDPPP